MAADLVATNGRVYVMDAADTVAEAVAVRCGRVLATGTSAEIESLTGPGTKVVDLGGRAIIPGLIDAHLHLLSFGTSLRSVDLRGVATIEEAVARVREAVLRVPPGAWVQGSGWDRNLFGRLPDRLELDSVSPANPVALASRDLHALWTNSRALEAARITAETEDPPNGEIVRAPADGEPTGVLKESARAVMYDAIPRPTAEEAAQAILEASNAAASKGLTSVQTFESEDSFRSLQQILERSDLPVRVCSHLWKDGLEHAVALGLQTGFGDDRLRIGNLKLFLDGALGSHTALMLEPYEGTSNFGIQMMTRQEISSTVIRAARASIAVAVHAIGDAANRLAIDVFEETEQEWRPRGLRQRIEHVQLLTDGDAARLASLGLIASMQPIHATSDWQVADKYWGARTRLGYAWRTIANAGARLAFGSDCPVESIDPFMGLHAAATRQTAEGAPRGGWRPEQRLEPLQALRAYTVGAAYASGEEKKKGSLEADKLADFVILSIDPFSGPPDLLLRTRVEATVLGGTVVYGEL